MKATYELRQIKDSRDKDLTRALSIYSQNIESIQRTDVREIIYWLDNYNYKFKDRFFILGFYLNNEIIGYSQFVYFEDEKIIAIDYIVIEEIKRRNNTFYQFLEEIRNFLNQENIHFDYLVAEVGYFDETKSPTEKSRSLIRLLKMSGFGVVKAKYFQPMLGKNNFESELMCILMVFVPHEIRKIKKETFQLIVSTIYYKHYKRWYDKFFDEYEQVKYTKGLDLLMVKINDDIKKKTFIEINGYANIFNTKDTPPPSKTYVKIIQTISLIVIFFLVSTAIGLGVVYLKKEFNLDATALVFISVASIGIIFSIFYIFFKNKEQSIYISIEKIIDMFT